ncbi:MAG: sugar phosphate isomerase/epimerase family protein [Clostridia bacterium]
MKISYNQACGLGCSTLEQDLILTEQVGFDFIEIRLDMLKKYLENHTLEDLTYFFENSTIKPHAINAIYVYDEFLSENDDLSKQEELLAEFDFACDVARMIKSNHIILVPPLQRDGGPYIANGRDTFENCTRILKKLAKRAEDVKICFELVGFDRSSVRSIEDAKAIVESVNLQNVGYVMDSYNIYLNGGTNDFSELKIIDVSKLFAVHLMSGDDVCESERGQDKRCFCGNGVVDTDNFLRILNQIGYDGMVSVETFRPEYWSKTPEWVINEAYQTTKQALQGK